eukprot:3795406-Rhodomonas_salina.1
MAELMCGYNGGLSAAGDGTADSRHPPPLAGQINALSPVAQYRLYRARAALWYTRFVLMWVVLLLSWYVVCTEMERGGTNGLY